MTPPQVSTTIRRAPCDRRTLLPPADAADWTAGISRCFPRSHEEHRHKRNITLSIRTSELVKLFNTPAQTRLTALCP